MIASLLLFLACTTTTTTTTTNCILPQPTLEPATGEAGQHVVATTGPLYTDWDTAILVGSTRAEIVELSRENCSDCDTCRAEAGCLTCGECETCTDTCSLCVETVTFATPAIPAGSYEVSILNQYGRSEAASFTVTAADTAPDSAQDSTP